MMNALSRDLFVYHQMKFPGKRPTFFSWLKVLFFSKGLLAITLHRLNPSKTDPQLNKYVINIVKTLLFVGRYFVQIFTKTHIRSDTIIDCGVYLSNQGHIILGAKRVGSGSIIHGHVTLGMNIGTREVPEIGCNVWIGPHSVIYGNIHVGDGATIMPHTVLTKSIPEGVVVQGNPARIVMRNFDNSTLRSSLNTNIDLHELKL